MKTVQKNIVSLLKFGGLTERKIAKELQIEKASIPGHVSHINNTTGTEIGMTKDEHGKRSYSITMVGDRRTF